MRDDEGASIDRRQRDLARRGVRTFRFRTDQAFLYVPGELLVDRRVLPTVLELLKDPCHRRGPRLGTQRPHEGADDRQDDERLPFVRLRFPDPDAVDIPSLVVRLRAVVGPAVGPNHVFAGLPHGAPNPATPPSPAPRFEGPDGEDGADVRLAVLDSGILPDHPFLHGLTIESGPHDLDLVDDDGDSDLDWESGHGTFIAGVVRQLAPRATVLAERVLDSGGLTSEDSLAHALFQLARQGKVDIVNLSLGGYSQDDEPPLALAHALHAFPLSTAIVASAGNNADDRPQWPAAFKRVVAVGALDEQGHGPAWFTDYGHWVDACAPGVNVHSSFLQFKGEMEADPSLGVVDFEYFAYWNGTSFSAPKFAASVAVVMRRKGLDAAHAAERLLATGRPVSGLGVAVDLGAALA